MSQHRLPRDILIAYAAATAFHAIPRLRFKKDVRSNTTMVLQRTIHPEVLRHATFLVTLPRLHAFLKRYYPKADLPIALPSALLYLVRLYYRRTIVIYAGVAAILNRNRNSRLMEKLPPIWFLNLVGNAWLLWAFLFHAGSFPGGYGQVILQHSGYGAPGEKQEELVKFLSSTQWEVYPPGVPSTLPENAGVQVHPKHTREFCAHVHSDEISCMRAYLKAWVSQFPRVFRWVGAFALIPIALRRKGLSFKIFQRWLISSVRGTAFVIGSINSSWALGCLFQRILPPKFIPRHRWLLNGFFGSLWVLILPPNRRRDFSLYVLRLSLISIWDIFDNYSPRTLEPIIFALSWISLLNDKRVGNSPSGLAGTILNYVERQS